MCYFCIQIPTLLHAVLLLDLNGREAWLLLSTTLKEGRSACERVSFFWKRLNMTVTGLFPYLVLSPTSISWGNGEE